MTCARSSRVWLARRSQRPQLAPRQLGTGGDLSCSFASATLSHAEAGEDLAVPEQIALDARYREGLVGDGGLSSELSRIANREMTACEGPWAQEQRFEPDRRGRRSPLARPHRRALCWTHDHLDLAKLLCGG